MSTPKISSRKKPSRANNLSKLFIYFVFVIIIFQFRFLVDSVQQVSSESKNKVYEDSLIVVNEEKYDTIEYNLKLITTEMKKKSINLKIKLLEKEIENSYRLLLDLDNMTPEQLGVTADYYSDRTSFNNQYSEGYYKMLYDNDSEVFDRIAELFKEITSEEELSSMDTINLIISMVQNIEYEIPKITEFEVLSPVLCMNYRYGDCDTKTLLLLVILRKIGVDCIHLQSGIYSHAMIGINVPSTGDYIKYKGIKYYFLETTYPGWDIGVLPPDVNNKIYWDALNY